ncbi:hypothetical protein CXF33_02800 [Corynebacterium bovis]|nr:hypothetical protein CXF33_02800 [Corynebacterium bovis]
MGWPRRWWALAVLSLGLVMLAVDVTVLNLAVPAIEADLAPSSTQMLWIVDVYGFVIGALLMTMGALGDRVGRRRLLLVGVAFFAVASVLAASATGPGQLIAARALQGAAGATLMPATLSLIRTMFTDDRERSRAVSVWVATYAVGAAAGPVIGGFLLEHFRWGAIFLINVPVAVVIVVAGLVTLPAGRVGADGDARPSPFDATGAVLSVVALFSGIYAVKTAVLEGVDAGVVATAVVAVVVGVLFVRHLGRAAHPLVDPGMLRRPSYAAAVTVNAGTMFLFVGMLIVVSPLLQTVLGVTPLAAGMLFLPGLVVSGLVAVWVGGAMDRFSPALLITAGLVVSALGLVVFVGCALGLLPGSGSTEDRGFAAGSVASTRARRSSSERSSSSSRGPSCRPSPAPCPAAGSTPGSVTRSQPCGTVVRRTWFWQRSQLCGSSSSRSGPMVATCRA